MRKSLIPGAARFACTSGAFETERAVPLAMHL
jgi:hypothetical protein